MPMQRTDPAVALPAAPGTYVLWLRAEQPARIAVGALGICTVAPGCYGYVGSAHGPGGVAARVGRHLATLKPARWHIDYLRAVTAPTRVWMRAGADRREAEWADALARLPGAEAPWPGFGASDRPGATHLYRFAACPPLAEFLGRLRDRGGDPSHIVEIAIPQFGAPT